MSIIQSFIGTALTISSGPPTYTLTPASNSVNEGSELTFYITGTNIVTGTYYWDITHIGTTNEDFAATSGSVYISGNSGSFGITATADVTTEGSETFIVALREGGTVLASSGSITINDTSQAPVTPTYTLSATGSNTANEGNGQEFNITGSNITNGTYYWTIENRISEFTTISGSFTITSNNGSFIVTPLGDSIAEGMEAYQIAVRSGSVTGPIVATTGANINDSTGDAAPTGLTSASPSSSAWKIKQDYPASTDGLYWIQNSNINGGAAVQVYCDMTTDGGGWTLLVQNNISTGWDNSTVQLLNSTTPPSTLVNYDSTQDVANNYSILGWADYIKKNRSEAAATFDYMMDAGYRGRNGGIWRANQNYSFIATDHPATGDSAFGTQFLGGAGYRKDITEVTKFSAGALGDTADWTYGDSNIEARMPFVALLGANPEPPGSSALLATDSDGSWWGTIIARPDSGFNPAPWMSGGVTGSATMSLSNPQVIWYWVR